MGNEERNMKAGTIAIRNGKNPKNLYLHQVEAIRKLNEKIHNQDHYAGLLVIPTGGGKTLTAVQWVLKNIIDQGKKVLWIAHRHELLNQALDAVVNNSYTELLENRKTFTFRVISGMHDRPVNIKADDDFIVASKDSISYSGMDYLVENWIKKNENDIFLVIDEAHHAVAKSYRNIINKLADYNKQSFKMLGLTATPLRTSDNEKGLLKKVFKDDITYGIDLKTLINREILADPIFIDSDTKIDMTCNLTDADIKKIHSSINLPEDIAENITRNKERNNHIVEHYKENQDKYRQTLVFALTIDHAIQLKAIFEKNKIPCDYVVSSIKDLYTGVTISNEQNAEKIKDFKEGKLKVLVNVNILTEGTDLPCVQTIFLTRPTTSTTLMTQMIGRALRGKKAGGTQNAYIVSFCDKWKDKIAWINPCKLYEDSRIFEESSSENREHITRLIAISKMEEFAKMMDDTVDTSGLKKIKFIERIPVGIYSFKLLIILADDETDEKHCDIMVYDSFKQGYEDFISNLEEVFKDKELAEKEYLAEYELDYLCEKVKKEYFNKCDMTICYRDEDIKDMLRYFAQTSAKPIFLPFEERENYDICKIANEIWKSEMNRREEAAYINRLWNDEKSFLKIFFGKNKEFFRKQVDNELYKLDEGSDELAEQPTVTAEEIDLKKLSLWEIRQTNITYWENLVNAVWGKFRDEEGYYFSASSNFKSKNKGDFQIDHIKPMAKGGLTELENLQLLTKHENISKRDTYEESAEQNSEDIVNDNDGSGEREATLGKIEEFFWEGDAQMVLPFIQKNLQKYNDADFYNELGRYHYICQTDFHEARKAYQTAIKLDENFLGAYFNLALLESEYHDEYKPEKYLNKILNENPNGYLKFRTLKLLADICRLREDDVKAEKLEKEALAIGEVNVKDYCDNPRYIYKDLKKRTVNFICYGGVEERRIWRGFETFQRRYTMILDKDGVTELEKNVNDISDNREELLSKIQIALMSFDEEILPLIKSGLQKYNDADFHNYLGLYHQIFTGNSDEAKKAYYKAIELDEECFSAYNHLIKQFYSEDDYENFENYAKKMLMKNKDNSYKKSLLELIEKLAMQRGEYDKALKIYDQVIELGIADDAVYISKGNILSEQLEKDDEALECFQKAKEINPENPETYCAIGKFYFERKDFTSALQHYNKALELDHELSDAHYKKGCCLKKIKDYDNAFSEFEKTIKLDPELEEAYVDLAHEFRRKRKYEEAIETFEKLISFNPQSNTAVSWMAYIYHKNLKNYQKALECYDKLLQSNPQYRWAINRREELMKNANI